MIHPFKTGYLYDIFIVLLKICACYIIVSAFSGILKGTVAVVNFILFGYYLKINLFNNYLVTWHLLTKLSTEMLKLF